MKIKMSRDRVKQIIQEEYDKLKVLRYQYAPQRDKGEGRPTKKERREIDGLDLKNL
mgnify:CR=1 FL=1